MKYAVVLEQVQSGSWGAYPIDFWGVAATEDSVQAALASIDSGIETHLEEMAADGVEPPKSLTAPLHPVKGLQHVSGYTLCEEMPEAWHREMLDGGTELLATAKRILAELDERDRAAGLPGDLGLR